MNSILSSLTEAEAFMAILLGAVYSDGKMHEKEVAQLSLSLDSKRLFAGLELHDIAEKLGPVIKESGFEDLIKVAATKLTKEQKESAFAIATDLILVDGVVTLSEKTFLDDLKAKLGISPDLANKIIEVMLLKNRD